MPIEIKIRKNEPVDRALRRLKKKLERENIIKDVRAKRYNEKPTERRRRKVKVMAFTQMLRYFEHEALAIMLCFQRAENRWQMPTFKFYVHNR